TCPPSPSSTYSSLTFFSTPPSPAPLYTLSLHDALPILRRILIVAATMFCASPLVAGVLDSLSRSDVLVYTRLRDIDASALAALRSEEHTSELQSRRDLVCRLLLEKKKTRTLRVK